jgi:hypothetical protein
MGSSPSSSNGGMDSSAYLPDEPDSPTMTAMGLGVLGSSGSRTTNAQITGQQLGEQILQIFTGLAFNPFLSTNPQDDPLTAAIEYLVNLKALRDQSRLSQLGTLKSSDKSLRFHPYQAAATATGAAAAAAAAAGPVAGIDGNWECPHCGNVNYARRMQCNRCGEQRQPTDGDDTSMLAEALMPFSNLAGRASHKSQPPVEGENGNWKCLDCKNVNYARRTACNRCGKPRNEESLMFTHF